MSSPSISNVLFTKTQQKVLSLLFSRPYKTFYLNEIVRLAGIGKGTVKRQLESMQAAGLLTVKHVGNQNHYQANKECPIYTELLAIVRKTFGIADVIGSAITTLNDKIDYAFIYGSIAKGEDTANSDIDLLIVADSLAYADMMGVLINAEQALSRQINPSIYDRKQIKEKLHDKNAFMTRVMEQPKLWIKGTEDDIRKIRQPGKD